MANSTYGLLAVPQSEIVEIHMSSRTTGLPVVNAYTQADMDQWTEGMGRTLSGAGATRNDTVQNAYGYGLFTGGMGVHYGTQRIGATVVSYLFWEYRKTTHAHEIFIQLFLPVLLMPCTWQKRQKAWG